MVRTSAACRLKVAAAGEDAEPGQLDHALSRSHLIGRASVEARQARGVEVAPLGGTQP
jgi:hypothetical protein